MANGNITCTVDRLFVDVDMRRRWSMFDQCRLLSRLRPGHVILMINSSGTLARAIDSQGGIHDYQSPEGERFNVERIQRQFAERILSIGVRVIQGRRVKQAGGEVNRALARSATDQPKRRKRNKQRAA